jgi:S-formylglutathione hydrolase FrmB
MKTKAVTNALSGSCCVADQRQGHDENKMLPGQPILARISNASVFNRCCIRNVFLFLLLLSMIPLVGQTAQVDSFFVYSASMKKDIPCTVIKPDSYKKKKKRFPVVFLLHGYSGWHSNWILRVPQLKEWADWHQFIIVCPDGGYSSWYFDSPLDSSMRYETHITKEVVDYIDKRYRTLSQPAFRAITGLSMGGHGAMFLGLRHRDVFGACGSMSGGVDLSASKLKFDIIKRIGDTIAFAQNWKDYTVYHSIDKYADTKQAIMFDCGTDDFYFEVNKKLHDKMLRLNIPHHYIERPGAHNWEYWENAVQHQFLFFKNYFYKQVLDRKKIN